MHYRRLVLRSFCGLAALAALPAWTALKKVSPDDPQAKSLGYVDDTRQVDQKKYPKHTNQQVCSGCQFYQNAQEQNKIAPCTIFNNQGVSAQGWCSAYVMKPK